MTKIKFKTNNAFLYRCMQLTHTRFGMLNIGSYKNLRLMV